MDKLKKIETQLDKMVRMQKQLEKKRKKLVKAAAKARKESAAKTRKLAAKAPASVECIASGVKKNNLRGLIIKSVCLAAFSTVVAVVVSTAIKRAAVQRGAADRNAEAVTGDLPDAALNTDYEKASLDELEEALLKVENQLDEVTAAIENSKK